MPEVFLHAWNGSELMAAWELDEGARAVERGSRVAEQESRPRTSCQAFAGFLDCLDNRGLWARVEDSAPSRHHRSSRLSLSGSKRYCAAPDLCCAAPDLLRRGVLLQVVNYWQP